MSELRARLQSTDKVRIRHHPRGEWHAHRNGLNAAGDSPLDAYWRLIRYEGNITEYMLRQGELRVRSFEEALEASALEKPPTRFVLSARVRDQIFNGIPAYEVACIMRDRTQAGVLCGIRFVMREEDK